MKLSIGINVAAPERDRPYENQNVLGLYVAEITTFKGETEPYEYWQILRYIDKNFYAFDDVSGDFMKQSEPSLWFEFPSISVLGELRFKIMQTKKAVANEQCNSA